MADDEGDDRDEAEPETPPAASAPDVSLSIDALLELLAARQRRAILQYLSDGSAQTATVDELVDFLIRREGERTGERPGRDRFEIELHHTHLPKLIDAGVVEYDPRTQTLRYWPDERLEDLLEYVQSIEES